ncbi:hypothetical protein PV405_30000 [Streptomyces sp. ME02-6979-3A]|uniref:hypothetical protein n=1 Tax=Streptomyces sp. ME02-6979-3A TaxID=3028673 RepID=UPI0029BC0F9A|nr:hypothetical protein [Streptomyces sp. ME02-6979-3A]MDX3328846.1 hypothetical protein [Streptomyces sp. ME02-6979-3A]
MSIKSPNPLIAHLDGLTAAPFIPELHDDDCDDLACARCVPSSEISRLDVPLPELIRQVDEMAALKRQRMADALLVEERHQCDPDDDRFASLPCSCTAGLATNEDYPGFAAWITQQEALNEKARRTA